MSHEVVGPQRFSPESIGQALRAVQKKAGITQAEMAGTVGIDKGTLSKILSGKRNPPRGIEFYENLRNLPNITDEDLHSLPGSNPIPLRYKDTPYLGISFEIYADPEYDDEEVLFLRDELSRVIRDGLRNIKDSQARIQQFFEKRADSNK